MGTLPQLLPPVLKGPASTPNPTPTWAELCFAPPISGQADLWGQLTCGDSSLAGTGPLAGTGSPVAELPIAVEGLQYAAGRLPVGQEEQHWLVLGQALRGTEVTTVASASEWGGLPGPASPSQRTLRGEGRAGSAPQTLPPSHGWCKPSWFVCVSGTSALGGGLVPEERDCLPEAGKVAPAYCPTPLGPWRGQLSPQDLGQWD